MAAAAGPPLAGVRVVELGKIIGGRYAAMLLADMGAAEAEIEALIDRGAAVAG